MKRSLVSQSVIARECGCSQATVAFALNERLAHRLAPATRQRILDSVHRLGYVPNHAARRLARSRGRARSVSFEQIGFIYVTPQTSVLDPACLAMMHGADDQLSAAGACLIFVRVGEHGWDRVRRLVQSGIVDAWLLAGKIDDQVIARLRRLNAPHVVIGDYKSSQPVHAVSIDTFGVGRTAAEHLLALGHRRIAFFGCDLEFDYQQQALDGFRAALREHRIEHDPRLIIRSSLKEWLAGLKERPTAIFSAEPAGEFIRRALAELRIRVPRQMSLLACEYALSRTIVPDLSRIELPMDQVGRQGAMLLERVVAKPRLQPQPLKLRAALFDLGSTRSIEIRSRRGSPESAR